MESFISYPKLMVFSGSEQKELTIKLCKPMASQNDDYSCEVEIIGLNCAVDRSYSIYGIDEVQALLLAVKFIKDVVTSTEEFQSGFIFDVDGDSIGYDFFNYYNSML